jgi:transposase InsO family protein
MSFFHSVLEYPCPTILRDMCNATWHAILNIQRGCNIEEVIVRFGTTYVIHTDQGLQFESNLFQEVCRLLQIQKTQTTPYNLQSDGMAVACNIEYPAGL